MTTRDEILEQPDVVGRLVAGAGPGIEAIAAAIRSADPAFVLIAARGTSDHAAIYAQYLFGVRHRLPIALAAPSIQSLYGVRPGVERALVIGISQSGASPDVVGVVRSAREAGAPTVAITNAPDSDLGDAAEHVIDLRAGPEMAVAATKTYTAELTTLAMLSAALAGDGRDRAALESLPAAIEAALALEPEIEAAALRHADAERCVVLGRGFEYATARELALKMKELGRVMADPYSAADFEHGPRALVEPGFPVVGVVSSGPTWPETADLLRRLRDEQGASLLVLSDEPGAAELGEWLRVPAGPPEWLRPIVSIVVGQLFALHLALARRVDPERPAHLRKVTLTR